ncbi:MAG TPA: hypothetical protein VGZ22_06700 [Isosphaeraceae bacterium]|nr:hypothetical protein [Isosphaeraceae bacterium]
MFYVGLDSSVTRPVVATVITTTCYVRSPHEFWSHIQYNFG